MMQLLKQRYADYVTRRERARIRNKGKQFLAELKPKGPNLDRVGQVFVLKGKRKTGINSTIKHV